MSLTPEIVCRTSEATGAEFPRRRSPAVNGADILHLAKLVLVVREQFGRAESFTDDAILASLRMISGQSPGRDCWRVAFASNLGVALLREGRDLNSALNTLLALLPRPTS